MWAAILVPIWLKNHDRAKVEKTIAEQTSTPLSWKIAPRNPASRKHQAHVRRRNVLVSLLAAVVTSAVFVILGVVPFYILLLPIGLLVAFTSAAARVATTTPRRVSTAPVSSQPLQQPVSVSHSSEIESDSESDDRVWQPVEPPVPSYVRMQRAGSGSQSADVRRSWTAQDMLEQAARVREERAKQMKESQRRIVEARAVALEKVRKAAIGTPTVVEQESSQRAVNE